MQPPPTGKTKNSGFQIGFRRTCTASKNEVWDFLCSDNGLKIWLGELVSGDLAIKEPYETKEGITGVVTVFNPLSHIRLTWKRKDWEHFSSLQIRVLEAKTGTTISFHQEKLLDSAQRAEMKEYWEKVVLELVGKLNA